MKRTNTAKWEEKYKRWKINVQKDGLRKSFYSSTPGRNGQREANKKADMWLDDNIEGTNAKIAELFQDYISIQKETTSQSNWRQLESIYKTWVSPYIGNKRIDKLNEQDLQNIINKANAAGRSKKTIKNIRAALMSFVKYCRKRKVTTLFPEDIIIPKNARYDTKTILQPKDFVTLMTEDTTVLRGKRIKEVYIYAYRLQAVSGLRPGEIVGLRWEDIKGDTLYINRAVNYYGEITHGKNEQAIRHFVLSPMMKSILESQYALTGSSEYIFNISTQQTYEKHLRRYCDCNDIPHISPYELRHTFVSIAKNLSEGQIKAIVGHSKNMDTFGTYGHEVEGELKETAMQLEKLFQNILSSGESL